MRNTAAIGLTGLMHALLWTLSAGAADFAYRAERFTVSGQIAFTDEFDDGVFAPWTSPFGNASESGGLLLLEGPGELINSLELLGGPVLSVSNAMAPASADVLDGGGDFVAEARFVDLPGPTAGPLGGNYSLQFFTTRVSSDPTCISLSSAAGEAIALEVVAVNVGLRNFDPIVPPFAGPTGLTVAAVSTRTCIAGIADPFDNRVLTFAPIDHVAVDPAQVTGDVIVRLDFDDATNDVTPSFSVDGGGAFTTMIPLLSFDDFSSATGRFQLIAQPIEAIDIPASTPVFLHADDNDPETEGWTQSGSAVSVTEGPIDDGGTLAWFTDDPTLLSGSSLQFRGQPTAQQNADAAAQGWVLSATLRVVDAPPDPNDSSIFVDYVEGVENMAMFFGAEPDGDPIVRLPTGDLPPPYTGPTYVVEGGAGAYHAYTLVFDPLAGSADLFIDGVVRLTDYTGFTRASPLERVAWGVGRSTGGTGEANWSAVSWGIVQPVEVPALGPVGAALLALAMGATGIRMIRGRRSG